MNELIATLIARHTHTVTDYSMGIDSSAEEFNKEAFALAVMQECISAVRELMDSTSYDDPVQSITELQAQQECCRAIKRHFGVK